MEITRFVGVYNAKGTLRGELSYWVNARFGRAHCALCDITHGLTRMKADWKTCRESLPVHFATFHLDDQPDAVRLATGNTAPVVVAETTTGIVCLLGPDELEACQGSTEALVRAVHAAVDAHGLRWPER